MIRKAKISDVKSIQKLVNFYARQGELLPRSLIQLYEHIRDFFVAEEGGRLVGCCALQIVWEELAEIRALAVEEKYQHKGLGKQLGQNVLEEAKTLQLKEVFTLTGEPEFFEKLGFQRVERSQLPHKIWNECINCPKFPDDCDEVPLVYRIKNKSEIRNPNPAVLTD